MGDGWRGRLEAGGRSLWREEEGEVCTQRGVGWREGVSWGEVWVRYVDKGDTQVPGLGTGWRVAPCTYTGTREEVPGGREMTLLFGCVGMRCLGVRGSVQEALRVWLEAQLWGRGAGKCDGSGGEVGRALGIQTFIRGEAKASKGGGETR